MILDDNQALDIVKANTKPSKEITQARLMAKELFALVEGKGFDDELIHRIEHLESSAKAEARRKYSRSIQDFTTRLLQPVNNIYSSVGGSKIYEIESDNLKLEYLKQLSSVSGNMSLEKMAETNLDASLSLRP